MPETQQTTADPAGIERTSTGQVADKGQTTAPEATTGQTSTQQEPSRTTETTQQTTSTQTGDGKSLANQAAEPVGAPETYGDWKTPDGWVMDDGVRGEIAPLFKKMNLTQAQGQELVDFYIKHTTESANAPYNAWNETQDKWIKEVKEDPDIGPKLNEVKTTLSRAIDVVSSGDAKLATAFRDAMDYTGAGNNPAFIKMFYKMAQMLTEGKHVAGGGASPEGQKPAGQQRSAAGAMYPNLPRA